MSIAFVLQPSVSKDLESRQVKCLCANDTQTMQRWVTCIRVGKVSAEDMIVPGYTLCHLKI